MCLFKVLIAGSVNNKAYFSVSPEADFWIIAVGRDEQGVRGVSLSFEGSRYCRSGDVAVTQFSHGGDSDFEEPSVGVGDVALNHRIASVNVRGSFFYNCTSGYSFVNASSTYQATALNFHGGRADSPLLTLTAPAP
jgi:hypothetical protein